LKLAAYPAEGQLLLAVAHLEIDGRGRTRVMDVPHIGGLGAVLLAGVQGAEPPLGAWGLCPQKLKPKNTSEAS